VDWEIPAFAKFMIVLLVTSLICLVTYHYLVRSTFIGKFLNGRKYPIKRKHSEEQIVEVKTV
jgi:hypothetical protein